MERSLDDLYPVLPGCEGLPVPPRSELERLRRQRGDGYRPRTRHLTPDGFATYTNRLFLESSPYLLQHAHNPVNWFPWGDEAFGLARELDRPVLVSIGYATCHWCHVMEEESFENEEIACFLNGNYIAVKVDREERPDLDSVYMTAVHAMGTQGGWPLNVFLTPQRAPFYGGTYFPPDDRSYGIGFLSLLKRIKEAYTGNREQVERAGGQVTEAVRSLLTSSRQDEPLPHKVSLELALRAYRDRFDNLNGGILGAPKFPSSLPLRLLLRHYRATGDKESISMADLTFRRMAAGGIYDQVAGGFHRYATDEQWMIPHFEKMLYDNALLAVTYLEGYQSTGNPEQAQVTREILNYLTRDLMSPEGAFYAATDADSLNDRGEREEGWFFTWTPDEVVAALGRDRAEVVLAFYGITAQGNFEGRSLPHRALSLTEAAHRLMLTEDGVRAVLQTSREDLYRARSLRPQPLRDEKILASWNGLALSAFARAGLVLDDAGALDRARLTASFLLERMTVAGRLAHSFQEGAAKGEGFLDDYAFVIAGLIDLFEATGEARWLKQALKLTHVVREEFEDREAGGYFMTGARHEELIAREKPGYDGVVPSGNSVMVMNLLRLNLLTEDAGCLEQAERVVDALAGRIAANPTAFPELLLALDFLAAPPKQIAIVAPRGNRQAAKELLDKLRGDFLPNRVLAVVCEGEELDRAAELVPFLSGRKADGDRAVAYLCEDRCCRLPAVDPEEFSRQLKSAPK